MSIMLELELAGNFIEDINPQDKKGSPAYSMEYLGRFIEEKLNAVSQLQGT